MKKLLILCLFAVNTAYADRISIRADEWYPVNGEPKSEMPGYAIEIAEHIFKSNGHVLDYKVMPWERSVSMVEKGKFNCVIGASKDDAPGFVFPKESQGKVSANIYTKAGSDWSLDGIESIKQIKVGAISGYSYADEFDEYVEANPNSNNIDLLAGNNALEQLIKKAIGGRIDAFVESPMILLAKLKELGVAGEIEDKGPLEEASDIYIACSPVLDSSSVYADMIDKGMQQMREDGTLKKILDKYSLKDWK